VPNSPYLKPSKQQTSGWPTASASTTARLTQSLSNNKLRDGRLRRHPQQFALPKTFQTTNEVCCLAFLMLTCLQERALDAVRIKKASQLC